MPGCFDQIFVDYTLQTIEMSSGDMKTNLDQMVQVLQHGTVLQNDVDAQNAVSQILKVGMNWFVL